MLATKDDTPRQRIWWFCLTYMVVVAIAVTVWLTGNFQRPRRAKPILGSQDRATEPVIFGYYQNWAQYSVNDPSTAHSSQAYFDTPDLSMALACSHISYAFLTFDLEPDPANPHLYPVQTASFPPPGNPVPGTATDPGYTTLNAGIVQVMRYNGSCSTTPVEINWEGSTLYGNPALQLRTFVNGAHKNGLRAYLSIGGWSDAQNTPRFSQRDVCDGVVAMLAGLVATFKPDGLDMDWEHLGNQVGAGGGARSVPDVVDYCMGLGYIMRKLHHAGIHVSYTTRPNAFWATGNWGSDGEGLMVLWGANAPWSGNTTAYVTAAEAALTALRAAPPASPVTPAMLPTGLTGQMVIPWIRVNLMTYDGNVMNLSNQTAPYTPDEINTVLTRTFAALQVADSTVSRTTVVMGFEPYSQANGAQPITDADRAVVIANLKSGGWGGAILWAINEFIPANKQFTPGNGGKAVQVSQQLYAAFRGETAPPYPSHFVLGNVYAKPGGVCQQVTQWSTPPDQPWLDDSCFGTDTAPVVPKGNLEDPYPSHPPRPLFSQA